MLRRSTGAVGRRYANTESVAVSSSTPFRYRQHADGSRTLELDRPGGQIWTCEMPREILPAYSEAYNSHELERAVAYQFLGQRPRRLLAWYACDCAERQFGPTRDRAEMEFIITMTVRQWVAGLVDPEACQFPLDETVVSTQSAWYAAKVVVGPDAPPAAMAAALYVQESLDPESAEAEDAWQKLRLSVLLSLPNDVWDDWVTFQAARDMADEELRPWSEAFLELVGVPRDAWSNVIPVKV